MKKHLLILILLPLFLAACQEDYIGQYPTDNVPPAAVKNVRVDNQPGKVLLHYDLPDVSDLLGVKARYISPTTGEAAESFSSAYVNSLILNGFGQSTKVRVTLVTVDTSYNESEPVTVEVEPLPSPIYEIVETMDVFESFGGLKLQWENAQQEGIALCVLTKNDEGVFEEIETFYSSAPHPLYTVRGLEAKETEFGFYCKDYYGNRTETVYKTLTPLFEEKLDKSKFKQNYLNNTKFPFHSYGGKSMTRMWNNTYNVANDLFYVQNTTSPLEPVNFSFDLGVTAKLSRFRLWTRVDYIYALHHVRTFEVWGTTDPAVAGSGESWDGWQHIMDCESIRPSGETEGGNPTAEEKQFVMDGEEWEFEFSNLPVVRYLRFKILSTWGGSNFCFINEIDLWGDILDN